MISSIVEIGSRMFKGIREKQENSHEHIIWFFIVLVLVLFVATIFAFQNDRPRPVFQTPLPTHRQARVYTVFYTSGVFSPTNIQIAIGDTIRFRNDSLSPVRVISDPHPLHTDLPGFDSVSEVPPQGSFTFTFVTKGIFGYHNETDPSQQGTVIVR
jgi:plastocyanin